MVLNGVWVYYKHLKNLSTFKCNNCGGPIRTKITVAGYYSSHFCCVQCVEEAFDKLLENIREKL